MNGDGAHGLLWVATNRQGHCTTLDRCHRPWSSNQLAVSQQSINVLDPEKLYSHLILCSGRCVEYTREGNAHDKENSVLKKGVNLNCGEMDFGGDGLIYSTNDQTIITKQSLILRNQKYLAI